MMMNEEWNKKLILFFFLTKSQLIFLGVHKTSSEIWRALTEDFVQQRRRHFFLLILNIKRIETAIQSRTPGYWPLCLYKPHPKLFTTLIRLLLLFYLFSFFRYQTKSVWRVQFSEEKFPATYFGVAPNSVSELSSFPP